MHEALYYQKLGETQVRCDLCPYHCVISDGHLGLCKSRKNVSGVMLAINYSRTVSINTDPIEKKPLFHYYPGTEILSLGANSCNLHCSFCQNFEISQTDFPTRVLSPDQLLDLLLQRKMQQVAFTYTEPFTWYEYILDCGNLLQPKGIRLVLVTNGYVNPEPLQEILPYIDAMNIDLKSMRNEFYTQTCLGKLEPVLDTIRLSHSRCHIELTNLIIPNLNDTEAELKDLVDFVASVDPLIPLHFSRYFPHWKCDQPQTPECTMLMAYEIAKDKLPYVYLGNMASGRHSDTHCPNCQTLLINHSGYAVKVENLHDNRCSICNELIPGRFSV